MPYEFKTKPYQHQEDVFRDLWDARHYALFMEMGTGKSKIAVDSIAALYEADKINTALIVAPKGVYHNWTNKELPAHMPEQSIIRCYRGNQTSHRSLNRRLLICVKVNL